MSAKVDATAHEEEDESSPFECNICLEIAKDPVVTFCGHLYCWPCLAKWFRSQYSTKICPVCKSDLEGGRIVPIYLRDTRTSSSQTEKEPEARPPGQYKELDTNSHTPTAAHNNTVANDSGPGILPTLFGTLGGAEGAQMTPEQRHQAFLTRLLLLLGSFVIICLLLF